MGTSHNYECKKCHKSISASLKDTEGMSSKVLAVKCNDCKEVGDSTIEQTFSWNNETVQVEPICEACESENVVKWDGKCPECNIEMIDKGVFLYWD